MHLPLHEKFLLTRVSPLELFRKVIARGRPPGRIREPALEGRRVDAFDKGVDSEDLGGRRHCPFRGGGSCCRRLRLMGGHGVGMDTGAAVPSGELYP